MDPGHLLKRISATLKSDIGPEVGNEFAKTQTFMASVVLDKLSKQLTLATEHAAAEGEDMEALLVALETMASDSDGADTSGVATAVADVQRERSVMSLGPLLEALHHQPDVHLQNSMLALIRPVLRRDIDRRMEVAG